MAVAPQWPSVVATRADYTLRTSMIGINNAVTGTNGAKVRDNLCYGCR